jgi:chromosome segregation ATPase
LLERLLRVETTLRQERQQAEAPQDDVSGSVSTLRKLEADMAALREGHDSLSAEVTKIIALSDELHLGLEATKTQVIRLSESLGELGQEREAAVAEAKAAKDRIRELTLELQRAGQWP